MEKTNEPVAWVYLEKWMAGIAYPDECFSDEELKGTLPLYTHPANVTYELTMEKCRQQQAEIEALKSVVYWLKENRPEIWDDIKKWSKL